MSMRMRLGPKTPMVYQAESSECALACLAMVAGFHGLDVSLLALRERFPISMKGATLRDVVELARRIGLETRSVRCDLGGLPKLRLPALLHWDFEHFVVLADIQRGVHVIHDPALGVLRLSAEEVSNHFTGIAAQFTPLPDFQMGSEGGTLTLRGLLRGSRGVAAFIAQVMWITAFLELFSLLSPMVLKTVIDTGLAHRDFDFITALAVGFAGAAVLHGLLAFARDYVLLHFTSSFNAQFSSMLFSHMLRLPMGFFSKRRVGDLIDRYQSANAIRQTLVGGLPRVLLDGLMAMIFIGILLHYSPALGAIALGTFLLYLLVRTASHRRTRRLAENVVKMRSEENGHVIETLRGMQPIKIFAKEQERLGNWRNHYSRLLNAEMGFGLSTSAQSAAKVMLLGLDAAASIYVGAAQVVSGSLTIGLLFALFVYKAQFAVKSMTLAEQAMELRMMGLHLDRLAEIALSAPEQDRAQAQHVAVSDFEHFRLEVDNVSARYGPIDPAVIAGASFEINAGDFVALIGPSGSGKTTVFRLILGLMDLDEGEIRFNGRPMAEYELQSFRRRVGVVMQDDMLLSGTILDNISFFDASPDETRARQCAATAMILDEIDAMPMKFNSRIGDLGSALSGGQKQRILLARALYHEPRILLLDEGTANLDVSVERQLLDNLAALGVTCVSIAHRPETILRANKVLRIEGGRVVEVHGNGVSVSATAAIA